MLLDPGLGRGYFYLALILFGVFVASLLLPLGLLAAFLHAKSSRVRWASYAAALVLVFAGPWLLANAYSSPPDYGKAFTNWFTQSAIAVVVIAPFVRALRKSTTSMASRTGVTAALLLAPPALLGAHHLFFRIDPTEPPPEDPKKAARYYRLRCNAQDSDSNACAQLAYLYQEGQGVERDVEKALALYEKACDGWSDWACYQLGQAYELGRGVASSLERSRTYYEKSCGIYGPSCNALGNLFRDGRGVAKDPLQAAELYRRACEARSPAGCTNLGTLYASGEGIERDWSKALSNFERACYYGRGQPGEAEGCFNLGVMYDSGRGVPRDTDKAQELFRTACGGLYQPGCEALP